MVPIYNVHLRQDSMRPSWRPENLLLGFLGAVLFCSPIVHANSVIWERGDQIVQLANQDDTSAPPNDHPYSITPGEIAVMLKTLRLKFGDNDDDSTEISVFTQAEIDNLGSAVATGLGRAAPSQDIIFHVIGARRLAPGAFAKRNRVSAGRIFYRDGNVNIIFGQVQTPYRKKNIYGQIDQDFYPRNYGSRPKATRHDVVLLTNDAASLTRDDWFVIEPGAAIASAAAASQPDAEPPVPVSPPASSAAPVVLAEAPTGTPPPAASGSSDTAKEQAGGTVAQSTRSTTDVEERLEALKRLREHDLISEEAYQAKMKEILQDL